jgi:hypothetical protein
MPFLKAADHKAIAWWAAERKLVPQLSTPPTMYFKNADGEEIKTNLFSIVQLYKGWKKEEARKNKKRKVAA